MKLVINQSPQFSETEIIISCSIITPELKKLIDSIRTMEFSVGGSKDQRVYRIPINKILYFDSVDGRTFIYTASDCFQSKSTLGDIEDRLTDRGFLRISKNAIINLRMLKFTQAIEAARMEVTMQNGERLIVTRHYLNNFKNAFGI